MPKKGTLCTSIGSFVAMNTHEAFSKENYMSTLKALLMATVLWVPGLERFPSFVASQQLPVLAAHGVIWSVGRKAPVLRGLS